MLVAATVAVVIVSMAFLLREIAPTVSARESAREVARQLPLPSGPVAGYGIRRELEYGLAFYCDRETLRYERGEIPTGDHLLIVRAGGIDRARALLGSRRVVEVGAYAPQHLEFWLVSR